MKRFLSLNIEILKLCFLQNVIFVYVFTCTAIIEKKTVGAFKTILIFYFYALYFFYQASYLYYEQRSQKMCGK